ncbi:MAG: SDR family NAD(P)-dependent oxidoreductase [Xanthomonadales bacterium]|nr:SDR family NAD(P)-dependent oxidoreductase [Xanthomonadales bacterium]
MSSILAGVEAPRIVLTGASGGIGLALLEACLRRWPKARIEALARRPEDCPRLIELAAAEGERLRLHRFELRDAEGLARLGAALAAEGPVQLLIHATGLLHGPGIAPERTIAELTPEALALAFAVNASGPALLTRALLPALRGRHPAVVAVLSAKVGSIGDNRLGGWYAHRAAKAALNQLFRCLAIELRRLNPESCVLLLHPGTVATRLSAPFAGGMNPRLAPEEAATRLLERILAASPADTGSFLAPDGSALPW